MATVRESAEERLRRLGMELPGVPKPIGAYVESVQSGRLLYLSGMLPVVDHKPRYVGAVGREVDVSVGREALRIAALNAISTARSHLGTLDRVARVVRLGIYIVASDGFVEHAHVADGASELFEEVFGVERTSTRVVLGVASLPLGVPVELDVVLEATS